MRAKYLSPFLLIALVAVLVSCMPPIHPCSITPFWWKCRFPKATHPVLTKHHEVCIGSDCKATLKDGGSMDPLEVKPREWVCWENCSRTNVVFLKFDRGHELFGRDGLRLGPGERVCLPVRPGAANKSYGYDFLCCDKDTGECKSGGVGGPQIDVGDDDG